MCPYQVINYTIGVEDNTLDVTEQAGPFTHLGHGKVSHSILGGIRMNHSYSVKVYVDYVGGRFESRTYYLSKCI